MGGEKIESEKSIQRKRAWSMTTYEIMRRIGALLPKRKRSSKKAGKTIKRGQLIFIWTILTIPILNWLIFWLYVNADSIMLAFKNIDYANGGVEYWTLDNFKEVALLFKEGNFLHYGWNTFKYWILSVIMGVPWSIILAYTFHKKLRGMKVYRVMMYLPSIICTVALAGIFSSFISGNGVLGEILTDVFQWERIPAWFAEDEYATNMLLFYSFFFSVAGNYVLYSGAMANVDKEITEAAYMDGVGMMEEILYIDIPLMWPTISMTIVTSIAGILGASGAILVFTPYMESTYTFSYWIFDQVRRYQAYYIPSALGLCFTLVVFPLTLLVRKLVDKMYTTE